MVAKVGQCTATIVLLCLVKGQGPLPLKISRKPQALWRHLVATSLLIPYSPLCLRSEGCFSWNISRDCFWHWFVSKILGIDFKPSKVFNNCYKNKWCVRFSDNSWKRWSLATTLIRSIKGEKSRESSRWWLQILLWFLLSKGNIFWSSRR